MVLTGHVAPTDVLECADVSTCLLQNALTTSAFIKIEADSDLEGSYLYFCLLSCVWVRSGKATGKPSSARHKKHKKSSMLKETHEIQNKFYQRYPDRQANFDNKIRRGYFDKLQQYSAASFRRNESGPLCSIDGNGLLLWPSNVMKAVTNVNFKATNARNIQGKQLEMVGYFFELLYDLSLSSDHNASESPGFETPLGIFGGDHQE